MTARASRPRYATKAAAQRAVAAAVAALKAQGLHIDVAGISFSPDGGVTVLTSRAPAGDDGWGDFK